jgi:DNA-binding MarR family transcriptional regulator
MTTQKRTSPARDVQDVASQLHATTLHLSRRLRAQDEARGISAPRLSALLALRVSGPLRIGDLAAVEQVEPPSMTRLIDKMQRDGLVARHPDPDDRRAVRVTITQAGKRALDRGHAGRITALTDLLGNLTAAELRALGTGVRALSRSEGTARR